jgi:hypothetical protein
MRLAVLLVFVCCFVARTLARTCVCGATWGGGDVNIRSCASTSCAVLGLMSPGECYDYVATTDVWYEIDYNSQTAFVSVDYVSGPQTCGGGTYCTANLCSAYSTNQKRGCDSAGCGNYGAARGTRMHEGWDVKCNPAGATVYAPFDGTVTRKAYPYGDGTCCDTGFEIVGSGMFSGHDVMIFYCEPDKISIPSAVTRGQPVATHRSVLCSTCYATGMTDHIHYQVLYNGVRIDPASFLFC